MQVAKQIIKIRINIKKKRDRIDPEAPTFILIGIPEKDNKEHGAEEIIKEMIEENFPEVKKDSSLGIIAYREPSKTDENKLVPRYILVKCRNSSDKEKNNKGFQKEKRDRIEEQESD